MSFFLTTFFFLFIISSISADDIDWEHLTEETIKTISAHDLDVANSANIGKIPIEACDGLSKSQISGMKNSEYGRTSCHGFKSGCFSHIPTDSYEGFQSGCIKNWDVSQISQLEAIKVAKIPPASFSGFEDQNMKGMILGCAGFTEQQVEKLSNEYPHASCNGITQKCFSRIRNDTFNGFDSKCVGNFKAAEICGISEFGVSKMKAESFSGFDDNNFKFDNEQCRGFLSQQLSNLNNEYPRYACAGFTSSCIHHLNPSQTSGLTTKCFQNIPDAAMQGFTIEGIAGLNPNSFSGWSSNQVKHLNPTSCKGLKHEQLSKLDNAYPRYACAGITKECMHNIEADEIEGIKVDCINQLYDDALSQITVEQIGKFSLDAFKGFKSSVVKNIPPESCSGFSGNQLGSFNNEYPKYACSGLTKECMYNIVSTKINGFKVDCVNQFSDDALSQITAEQLGKFSLDAFKGFKSSVVKNIPPESCNGFTTSQIGVFNNEYPKYACSGLTADCMMNLHAEKYEGFLSDCSSWFVNDALSKITPEQLQKFTLNDGLKGIKGDVIEHFNLPTCEGITADILSNFNNEYPYYACGGLKKECIEQISIDVCPSFNEACTRVLTDESVLGFSMEKLKVISTDGYAGFSGEKFARLYLSDVSFIDELTKIQLKEVDMNQIANFILNFYRNKGEKEARLKLVKDFKLEEFPSLTWLQVAALHVDGFKSISSETLHGIGKSLSGLRPDMIFNFEEEDVLKDLDCDDIQYLLTYCVFEISSTQISHMKQEVFQMDYKTCPNSIANRFDFIQNTTITGITESQWEIIFKGKWLFTKMTCAQYYAMSEDTVSQFENEDNEGFKRMYEKCVGPTPPGPTPPGPGPAPPNPGAVVGIVFAVFLGVCCVPIFILLCVGAVVIGLLFLFLKVSTPTGYKEIK